MGRIQGDLLERSFRFAQSVIGLFDDLPNNGKGWEIGRQLIRSGTGIGANVREANHAISDADFAHKCSIARKEASETLYWLELCRSVNLLKGDRVAGIMLEADELVSVLSAVVRRTQEYIQRERSS